MRGLRSLDFCLDSRGCSQGLLKEEGGRNVGGEQRKDCPALTFSESSWAVVAMAQRMRTEIFMEVLSAAATERV